MQTRAAIFKEVQTAMVELFELEAEQVTEQALLYQDLDLDSIDAVDLVVRLQNLTGKKIQPEEFKAVRTVGDVVDAVEALLR
ncbi:acyl carrier protein [Aestuariirhabdus litorea]|uniref:Acyl carrier protein n=1 Tax=Aestuariirhabdus litorea TaxID=2528527 RepID=A0A3P3VJ53_9GAMM|nr:acyl carrier protein [Aestuariirhabdus litorea]RRJ82781.1 acyl carrier protein [Aestuariirhabdus litorea]RWW92941.1 acyl carrier protein [Endozoicomonadaceae bacterium GTF-13]